MENLSNSEKIILKAFSEEIKRTTVIEEIGEAIVMYANPDMIFELIKKMQDNGISQIQYKGVARALNPELARKFAQTARNILRFTIKELASPEISPVTGKNCGSTTTGLVTPQTDIDIKLDFASIQSMKKAGQFLQHNPTFQEELWKVPADVIIPVIEYSLSVPSAYKEQPGEKWIPKAHAIIKIPNPIK